MKSSQSILLQRIREITNLLINGNSRDSIVQYSSENWSIGERQTDKYIQKAKEVIETSIIKSISYDYAKAVSRYEELYKHCIERKDFKTATNINKELANLQGLYKHQIEHSGEVQFICPIPD